MESINKPDGLKAKKDKAPKFSFVSTDLDDDKTSQKLSVLSYNILANCYCDAFHFRNTDPGALDFKVRVLKLLKEIQELNADIICLQEVDNFDNVYKKALRGLGYELYFKRRKTRYDGCLIGLKVGRGLRVLSKDFLDMDFDHRFVTIEDFVRDNLAIHLRIEDKMTGKIFNVINTHFYWNPDFDYVKYLQMYLVVRWINKNIKEDESLIFCGDLNSMPDSNAIRMLLAKGEALENSCTRTRPINLKFYEEIYNDFSSLKSPFKWEGAYQNYKNYAEGETKDQGYPDYTNYTEVFKGTLDHIFYTPKKLVPVKLLKIPAPREIKSKTLPNLKYPSDHLPIMVLFDYGA